MLRNLLLGGILVLSAWAGSPVRAEDGSAWWLRPVLGQLEPHAKYEARGAFRVDVDDQATRLNFFEHRLDAVLPLAQDERSEWSLDLGLGQMDLRTGARLPDTGGRLPDDLWAPRIGTTWRGRLDNDWLAGVNVTLASPSDKPFDSVEEVAVRSTGFVRIPRGERDAWVLMLNIASDREFAPGVPIPGVAYEWNPDDRLQALMGLPFTSARYRPHEKVTLSAAYRLPRTVHAKAAWEAADGLTLFGGFDWSNRRWFRHDRSDDDDRLHYYEKHIELGAEVEWGEAVTLTATGGYAFDRMFFEGEDYDDRGRNRIDLADGPYLGLELAIRF